MRKKSIRATIFTLLLVSIFSASLVSARATQIELMYTGVSSLSSSLTISTSGGATCAGRASVRSGYTVDLTVELKQDGSTIKTWTSEGTGIVSAGGVHYVMSGHSYVVTTTATVYDSNNHLVENPDKDSLVTYY
ncbi:hypothetical protein [uncultured Oscillibacter sp.]|uniref:hypothetical protein n=1 Tax=uncultured Oscillibacter sp. TaxID=876091 RepID=UPI0025F7E29A|nr:hypothetical protein [uncultured Oscillibacter sp.]